MKYNIITKTNLKNNEYLDDVENKEGLSLVNIKNPNRIINILQYTKKYTYNNFCKIHNQSIKLYGLDGWHTNAFELDLTGFVSVNSEVEGLFYFNPESLQQLIKDYKDRLYALELYKRASYGFILLGYDKNYLELFKISFIETGVDWNDSKCKPISEAQDILFTETFHTDCSSIKYFLKSLKKNPIKSAKFKFNNYLMERGVEFNNLEYNFLDLNHSDSSYQVSLTAKYDTTILKKFISGFNLLKNSGINFKFLNSGHLNDYPLFMELTNTNIGNLLIVQAPRFEE